MVLHDRGSIHETSWCSSGVIHRWLHLNQRCLLTIYICLRGLEELNQLLYRAYLELERARAKVETQRRLQEARLLHLQELSTATRREREQLVKLEAEYSNTQQPVMSSDRSQWPDTKLAGADLGVNLSTMHYNFSFQSAHPPSLVDLSPDNNFPPLADQFHWNSTPANYFDFRHLDLQADIDLHRPPISSSNIQHLMELQGQPIYDRQEQQQLSSVEWQEFEQQHQVESHLPSLVEDKSPDHDFCHQQQETAAAAGLRQWSNPLLGISEASAGGHMTHHQLPKSVHAPPPSILGCTSAAMPAHMPEPPRGALPERGKLLQAVMQAGPLLRMLLLTGPLPQWRFPPPALDTVEIPRISICSSPNFLPIDPIAHPVPNPDGPADPNSAVSSSHRSLRKRRRISKPPIATVITSRQSGSKAASSSSKLLFAPVLNSMDSSITANSPLDFAKIQ